MNNILSIRKRFGLSQADFGLAIGVSQGNVSHYELGRQEVPPDVARRIKAAAEERGISLSFDDIYGPGPGDTDPSPPPSPASPAPAGGGATPTSSASGSGVRRAAGTATAASPSAGSADGGGRMGFEACGQGAA